ncbi:hypothetical protein OH77DRAFT_1207330 [Trametes cingulata]|nr:hypothetical protein OH77DRAFT_1207330 [Trametes cingulata]
MLRFPGCLRQAWNAVLHAHRLVTTVSGQTAENPILRCCGVCLRRSSARVRTWPLVRSCACVFPASTSSAGQASWSQDREDHRMTPDLVARCATSLSRPDSSADPHDRHQSIQTLVRRAGRIAELLTVHHHRSARRPADDLGGDELLIAEHLHILPHCFLVSLSHHRPSRCFSRLLRVNQEIRISAQRVGRRTAGLATAVK